MWAWAWWATLLVYRLEKQDFTFFQRCLQPLYFSWSPPPTLLSLPFCAGVQFSRNFIGTFNDRIKIYEKTGDCEQPINSSPRFSRESISYLCCLEEFWMYLTYQVGFCLQLMSHWCWMIEHHSEMILSLLLHLVTLICEHCSVLVLHSSVR